LTPRQREIAGRAWQEVADRLDFLLAVGLGYLTLWPIPLPFQAGRPSAFDCHADCSRLRGVLYVLDEPSIGLHARDNEQLLRTLELARSRQYVLCGEHDEETIRRRIMWLIRPGRWLRRRLSGAEGSPAEIAANPASLPDLSFGRSVYSRPNETALGNGRIWRF